MTTDLHGLVSQMADELDRCQQLLLDDRRQRHPLADRARAVLAEADGPAVPDGREPASVATQPTEPEAEGPTDEALDELFTEIDQGGEALSWRAYARAVLARWGNQSAPPAEGEVPQGWHMLCDIEPEPGTMCDWVIMAPWGCDHGNDEWRHFDGSPMPEFFDLPAGCGVHGKGFAGKRGLMVSDPKLTAWRAQPLPAGEVKWWLTLPPTCWSSKPRPCR